MPYVTFLCVPLQVWYRILRVWRLHDLWGFYRRCLVYRCLQARHATGLCTRDLHSPTGFDFSWTESLFDKDALCDVS